MARSIWRACPLALASSHVCLAPLPLEGPPTQTRLLAVAVPPPRYGLPRSGRTDQGENRYLAAAGCAVRGYGLRGGGGESTAPMWDRWASAYSFYTSTLTLNYNAPLASSAALQAYAGALHTSGTGARPRTSSGCMAHAGWSWWPMAQRRGHHRLCVAGRCRGRGSSGFCRVRAGPVAPRRECFSDRLQPPQSEWHLGEAPRSLLTSDDWILLKSTTQALNGSVLADIYDGGIAAWDGSALADLNPTLNLPSANITTVYGTNGTSDDTSVWMESLGHRVFTADLVPLRYSLAHYHRLAPGLQHFTRTCQPYLLHSNVDQ